MKLDYHKMVRYGCVEGREWLQEKFNETTPISEIWKQCQNPMWMTWAIRSYGNSYEESNTLVALCNLADESTDEKESLITSGRMTWWQVVDYLIDDIAHTVSSDWGASEAEWPQELHFIADAIRKAVTVD